MEKYDFSLPNHGENGAIWSLDWSLSKQGVRAGTEQLPGFEKNIPAEDRSRKKDRNPAHSKPAHSEAETLRSDW